MSSALLRAGDRELAADERATLSELRDVLVRLEATPESLAALGRSMQQLDELFLLVVVGEFNSGKSAFINALLGGRVLEEGVTPTTAQVHLLQYGASPSRVERTPAPARDHGPGGVSCATIHMVDTPGTNAVVREHEAITADFVPRSDLVLFVTSADRPFTESERAVPGADPRVGQEGRHRPQQGRSARVAPRSCETVVAFIAEHARAAARHDAGDLSGQRAAGAARQARRSGRVGREPVRGPRALPARAARRARAPATETRQPARRRRGAGGAVRRRDRRPAGVCCRRTCGSSTTWNGSTPIYRDDMDRQFGLRMAEIENVLLQMEQRGHVYFDEMLRIGRVFDLLNKARVREGFRRRSSPTRRCRSSAACPTSSTGWSAPTCGSGSR